MPNRERTARLGAPVTHTISRVGGHGGEPIRSTSAIDAAHLMLNPPCRISLEAESFSDQTVELPQKTRTSLLLGLAKPLRPFCPGVGGGHST